MLIEHDVTCAASISSFPCPPCTQSPDTLQCSFLGFLRFQQTFLCSFGSLYRCLFLFLQLSCPDLAPLRGNFSTPLCCLTALHPHFSCTFAPLPSSSGLVLLFKHFFVSFFGETLLQALLSACFRCFLLGQFCCPASCLNLGGLELLFLGLLELLCQSNPALDSCLGTFCSLFTFLLGRLFSLRSKLPQTLVPALACLRNTLLFLRLFIPPLSSFVRSLPSNLRFVFPFASLDCPRSRNRLCSLFLPPGFATLGLHKFSSPSAITLLLAFPHNPLPRCFPKPLPSLAEFLLLDLSSASSLTSTLFPLAILPLRDFECFLLSCSQLIPLLSGFPAFLLCNLCLVLEFLPLLASFPLLFFGFGFLPFPLGSNHLSFRFLCFPFPLLSSSSGTFNLPLCCAFSFRSTLPSLPSTLPSNLGTTLLATSLRRLLFLLSLSKSPPDGNLVALFASSSLASPFASLRSTFSLGFLSGFLLCCLDLLVASLPGHLV